MRKYVYDILRAVLKEENKYIDKELFKAILNTTVNVLSGKNNIEDGVKLASKIYKNSKTKKPFSEKEIEKYVRKVIKIYKL